MTWNKIWPRLLLTLLAIVIDFTELTIYGCNANPYLSNQAHDNVAKYLILLAIPILVLLSFK